LAVVDADRTSWSDWGTREAIERTFAALNQVPPWLLAASHRMDPRIPLRA
jgi:hypothetical protein